METTETQTQETVAPSKPPTNEKPSTGLAVRDPDASFGSAAGFALLQRGATLLAASTLVPEEYRGNIPNCTIALNMAQRIGADPLMVMQNLYVVHGRPGWSAQFLIATFNQCGRFTAIRYEWTGDAGTDGRGCRAWAIEKDTGERLVGSLITLDLAKKEGWYDRKDRNGNFVSKWRTMQEQMTMYRAAAWFVRAYAPEIAMGLHTTDEMEDAVIDVTPRALVVTPASLTPGAVAAGATTGQDAPETEPAAPPLIAAATPEAIRTTPKTPDAPVGTRADAGATVAIRLKEIQAEVGVRGVKKAIVDHLFKKHLDTADMATVPHDEETFAKLGRVLHEMRSIPAAKKGGAA